MIRVFPFATALAGVSAAFYVLCAVLALLAPSFFLALFQTWVHGLNLSLLAAGVPLVTPAGFVVGLVTFTLIAWLFGAVWGALYNALGEAREVRA
ncbi:MAG: hypothetical protein HY331_15855 [Chloroflexi bacterium]|nr:hypothetical protein [Chloroflexota bacterium]